MDVIIIGAGKVGYTLAKFLSKEEDNITVIDNNIDALNSIIEKLDIMGIKGNGTSLKILHEAGISKADLVISVTGSDEVNMLCSLAVKKLGAKYTIARVRAPQYSEEILMLKDELGIDLVINPEKEAALEIAKLIKFPSVRSVDTFAKGKVDLVGFTILEGDGLDGEAIQDIKYLKDSILISGVERDGEIHIPSGDFVLHKNDKLYVIGEHKKIEVFFKRLGKFQDRIKNPLIIGGGRITHYLVNIIDSLRVTSKIIELDLDKCIELNETLPEAIVINGDGTDHELLLSENLQEADAFIALTGRDEENVLTSLFAINNNVKNVITKVTRFNYNVIAKNVGIDTIISPKAITANKILKYIRFLKNKKKCCIENIYKIFDEQAEAIEFLVREDVKFLNRKLKDINIINDIIIATIVRNDKIIIPSGDDKIELGDRVIIITKRDKLVDINDIVVRGNK
ncbi:Trk system potassium transporter TrkA [Clostridium saudiense]|uniref:Trk system potassium transporter TrkA n=1 Tax=Clostridium saudiense TaxID=1414720 RepID=UPI0018A99944|nr:Trk system potassium transporter TrkA [Clostridium saudiense]